MVTHSMHQAAHLGDRLIMMAARLHDFSGAEKKRLRPEDLLSRLTKSVAEQLDESAAEMVMIYV